mgnify:CR=1 FL=1
MAIVLISQIHHQIMKIVFDKVMPYPLDSIQHGSTSIWGNKMEVAKGQKILLNQGKQVKLSFHSILMGELVNNINPLP